MVSFPRSSAVCCLLSIALRTKPQDPRPREPSEDLEVERRPGLPPIVSAGDEARRAGHLDATAVPVLLQPVRGREDDLDLARAPRIVRPHCLKIAQRIL